MERKLFNIFLASPSDLATERKMMHNIVERINKIIGRNLGWHIEFLTGGYGIFDFQQRNSGM